MSYAQAKGHFLRLSPHLLSPFSPETTEGHEMRPRAQTHTPHTDVNRRWETSEYCGTPGRVVIASGSGICICLGPSVAAGRPPGIVPRYAVFYWPHRHFPPPPSPLGLDASRRGRGRLHVQRAGEPAGSRSPRTQRPRSCDSRDFNSSGFCITSQLLPLRFISASALRSEHPSGAVLTQTSD